MKWILPLLALSAVLLGCQPDTVVVREPENPPAVSEHANETPVAASTQPKQPENTEATPPKSLTKPVKVVEPPKVVEHSQLFKWAKTKEAGLSQAKMNGGFVLLKFEADWCGPCQIMKREAFQDKTVAKLLAKAVVVPIDVDTPAGQKLAEEYNAFEIPKLVFLKPDGKNFGEIFGYMNVDWLKREVGNVFKRADYKG